jgi:hypothetical protein
VTMPKGDSVKGSRHHGWTGGVSTLSNVDDALTRPAQHQQDMVSWIRKCCTVNSVTGCWEWDRRLDRNGYPVINLRNGTSSAHRLSFVLRVGPIGNLHVLHKCDNPKCVNPDHLFLGTHLDNMRDAARKNRFTNRPIRRGKLAANYKHGRYCA